MVLLDVLFTTVGTAVAKTILKYWVGESGLTQELGGELIDLLKAKIPSATAARNANRQFEAIAEKVAQTLEPLFQHENLTEESRQLVAQTAAEALLSPQITVDSLAKWNFDPNLLYLSIKETSASKIESFSQVESDFYDRVIKESAQYVMDIARELPGFDEKTMAEVLRREDYIRNIAFQTLEEVIKMREQIRRANPKLSDARFEEEYKRAVIRKLDRVELFGIDVSAASRRHRLTVAYINLSVSSEALTAPSPASKGLPSGAGDEHEHSGDESPERIIRSVDEVLTHGDRLMIRGLAGCGKTTFVKWIAVQCAGRRFDENLAMLNDKVPFVVFLRRCIDAGLPAPEDFVRHLVPSIAETMPDGWVHALLASGRAVVMIDGVDEVPQTQRKEVHEWIQELVDNEQYRQSKFVVTTRPTAVEEGWLSREGFTEFEFEPMGTAEIHKFIDHWHKAVKEELQFDKDKAELDELEVSLREKVTSSHAIRNLATNPLLCAAICALHRDRRKEIPPERLRLYDACCEMLLDRRDKEQRILIVTKYAPRLTYGQNRALLEEIAYWMIRNGRSMITFADADARITEKIKNLDGIAPDITASDIRDFLIERSGIVRSPVETKMDFIHRTFQEFLAAKAVIDDNDTGFLVKNALDDQWREVIILAAGHAPTKMRNEFIKELIGAGDKNAEHRHHLHLLAVACLETAAEIDREVRNEVEKRLGKLIPPKNKSEAKTIAAAGDLAAKQLGFRSRYRASEAAACVYALKLIASDLAILVLKSYAEDHRRTVIKEIVNDPLDSDAFRREILTKVDNVFSYLPINYVIGEDDFESILAMPQIKQAPILDFSGYETMLNLSMLPQKLPKLKRLNLNRCTGLQDVEKLPEMLRSIGIEPAVLRHQPQVLSDDDVRSMLRRHGFFDCNKNAEGIGVSTACFSRTLHCAKVVVDYATGLTWQQGGSSDSMVYKDAQAYIRKLNAEKFAGRSDWRLPTLEEAMSLMEPSRKNSNLYIDPVFDKTQRWIWTADTTPAGSVWVVIRRWRLLRQLRRRRQPLRPCCLLRTIMDHLLICFICLFSFSLNASAASASKFFWDFAVAIAAMDD